MFPYGVDYIITINIVLLASIYLDVLPKGIVVELSYIKSYKLSC
nr:MAG TPA: hypothetical protein [Caudoviricetes sp.]